MEGGGGAGVDGMREGGALNFLVVGAAPRVAESDDRGVHEEIRPAEKLGLVRG